MVSGVRQAHGVPPTHKLLLSPSCAALCLISSSIYSDLFFLLLKISAACFEILTLIATVRPVAGRPDANLLPAFIFVLFKYCPPPGGERSGGGYVCVLEI